MKYLLILLTIITLSSCSGTKRVTENTQKNIEKSAPVTEEREPVKVTNNEEKDTLNPNQDKTDNVIKEVPPKKIKSTKTFNHSTWHSLLQKHVSNNGNVNYKNFKLDRGKLTNYITLLAEHMPQDSCTKKDKLAYWINAYNAMTIDLILRYYPVKSIKDIDKPWEQRFWKLGEKWYNLNEIEHQILRKMDEPRIHFAIVCASFSCPKLQNEAFTSSNLDEQLTHVTKDFLSDSDRNNISKNNLELSKIFQWFSKDFKQSGSLIDFLNQYTEITISNKAKKKFKAYNWNLNE
ncbi:DUF547 domain-containing protein [Flavivirga eckloniae]|uniref:DUF547 domain-containing protein n=1 Tax=Flavivirga eckloniae TaxID=1803846 RepID=A0A2K9PT38_9FLAO|nr:DUF547 domain-containing protein [Flavivirga eckloniae]AUP80231.1 DUF547 domain-containing protein [Flavivirga eckloniae]